MNLARLIVAAVLAVLAAAGNFFWLYRLETSGFGVVGIKQEVRQGKLIESADLIEVKLHGEAKDADGKKSHLARTFVAWGDRALLFGTKAVRNYSIGDVVLQQELNSVYAKPHWKALGPFKLLSVGERVRTGSGFSEGRESDAVTISAGTNADGNYDQKTEHLLDIIASQSDKNSRLRIIAIQINPVPDGEDVDDTNAVEDVPLVAPGGNPALFVPLRNVESIPEVMVRGSYISFIVQWFDEPVQTPEGIAKDPYFQISGFDKPVQAEEGIADK